MYHRALLFLSLFAALPALAQVDRYGRSIAADARLPPPGAATPSAAPPAPARGAAFTLLPYQSTVTGSWADTVAIGDVTGDARADVVLATGTYFSPEADNHVFVFPQSAAGSLLSPSKTPYQQTASRTGLALGNFDGQGGFDVAVGATGAVLLNAIGTAPWLAFQGVVGNDTAVAILRIDLDGTGRDDFVSVSWQYGGARFIANANGGYDALPWAVAVAGWNSMASGDLDGDGIADLVTASGQGGSPNVRLNRNNHDGTLSEIGSLDASCGGWRAMGVGIGDFDHDGVNDIVASAGGNSPSSCLLLFRGTGGGQFAPPQTLVSYDIPETLRVADINLDGRDDVLVLHGGWTKLGVYLQRADGTLAPEQLFDVPYASHYNAQGMAVGDFSGDGCPDIAIADYNAGLVTLRNGMDCDSIFANRFD